MADQPTEPSNTELLERIEQLEKQNARLMALIDDLSKGVTVLSEGVEGQLCEINDALWPLVHKAFPNFGETKKQLDQIIPPVYVDPRADKWRWRDRKD